MYACCLTLVVSDCRLSHSSSDNNSLWLRGRKQLTDELRVREKEKDRRTEAERERVATVALWKTCSLSAQTQWCCVSSNSMVLSDLSKRSDTPWLWDLKYISYCMPVYIIINCKLEQVWLQKVQKMSSGQTLPETLNICCDTDPEHSNPIFLLDTQAYDDLPANYVWFQMNRSYRRYGRNSHLI